jgi:hypothetical protein
VKKLWLWFCFEVRDPLSLYLPIAVLILGVVRCATVHEDASGTQITLCKLASDVVVKATGGHTAVTLPGRISLLPPDADPALRCHEGIHREQEIRIGPDKWPAAYLLEHLRHGYEGNAYEKEARDRCAYLGPS